MATATNNQSGDGVQAVVGGDLPRTRAGTYADIYSNLVTGNLAPHDITLTFGRIKQGTPGMLVNEEQCSVTLTPAQFKLLSNLCARLVEGYELAYLPIELPASEKGPKLSGKEIADMIKAAAAAGSDAALSPSNESSQSPKQSVGAGKSKRKGKMP